MTDILLRGGSVVDGSGRPKFPADVAVEQGRIAAVGDLGQAGADLVLDVSGLTVAPGFIDAHSHSGVALLEDGSAAPKVAQGVTTEIIGNCGFGPFPAPSAAARQVMSALVPRSEAGEPRLFASLRDYQEALMARGSAVNVAALLPHGAIRTAVVGAADRPADEGEVRAMCELVGEGMAEGAVGMSLGLLYAPGCFTPAGEIAELSRAMTDRHGVLVSHGRNECDRFQESIEEVIEIGRETGVATHVSHLKVADPANWGRVSAALDSIDRANDRGQLVTCDQYPYTAGSGPFQTIMPPWSLAGGTEALLGRLRAPAARTRIVRAFEGREAISGWDNMSLRIGWDRIVVGSAPGTEGWEGRSLAAIAADSNRAASDVLFDVLLVTHGSGIGIFHQMCEEDVRTVMVHPAQMVGSDGLPGTGKPHPRLWGSFPRVLGHYSRELGLMALEQAVHKMTGKTAEVFRLHGRGLVGQGRHADVCVFDAERIIDRATYDDPVRAPEGIVHVICNGVPVMLDGERTRQRPGVALGAAAGGG
jgi:dihydroorotase/N-acyl-D-amino-acid deacylase